MKKISELKKEHIIVAIDGKCASGKTTLALNLKKRTGCNVIHMDSFFLRPEQRTPERLNTPGGNIDRERFLEEALLPLRRRAAFSFSPYNCRTGNYDAPVAVLPVHLNIVEGAYSCHPSLRDFYDLRIFLTVDRDEQLRRIKERNGEKSAERFADMWIPLEEKYFSECDVEHCCQLYIKT